MKLLRPPRPFQFGGEVRQPLDYDELAILEAAARRRQVFRQMSADELRQQVQAEQAKSGIAVRIERPVLNYAAFVPQMAAWYRLETEGMAARRKLGRANGEKNLHVTLLDTRDPNEQLGTIDDSLSLEELERKLAARDPSLFRNTGRVAFTGIELFGPRFRPWLALPLSPQAHTMHRQRQLLREAVAPNCGDSGNRLHTSLGDITVHDASQIDSTFQALQRSIRPLLPQFIEYGPVSITVRENSSA